ncbi:MAG: DUF4838 domain-containing protein [Clostridia bacterium]|nr:DUF4838 domain-containing protein [Clostridia bacterium]
MTKKILSLILTAVLALSALISCTGDAETTPADTVTDAPGTEVTDTEADVTDAPEDPVVTVKDVKIGDTPLSDFCVVTAEDAASGIISGAKDLIRLIKFATGYEPELKTPADRTEHAIVLGSFDGVPQKLTDALTEVKDDGYALIQDGADLYISGVINRGTLNGLYDFLQDFLGMRFYSETFTYVKAEYVKNVPAGQRTVFNPIFPGRYNWSRSPEVKVQRFVNRTKSTSIKYGGSHNLGSLSKTGDGFSNQPCLSDPKIIDTVFESLCAQIDKNPTKTLFHINQNDGGKFCTCAECKAKNEAAGGTAMGSMLVFMNEIADRVKEKYPDRDITLFTYAYHDTTIAPDPSFVVPRDNVAIVLCMMNGTCFNHAYNDPNCEHNRETFVNMQNWAKICKKFAIYDYSYNHASSEASVGPDINVLWDNMQAFMQLGCIGLLFEGDHLAETGEFCELRNYLINRLMWQPDVSREQFITWRDEFLADYYGEAAPYILEYIELVNDTSRRAGLTEWDGHTSVYTDPKVFYAPSVDGKKDYTVIKKCGELWDQALSCQLDDEQFAHVEKSSVHFRAFQQRFGETSAIKRAAGKMYSALCDKYTHNWDGTLTAKGPVEGFSTEIPSEGLEFRRYADGTLYVSDVGTFRAGVLVIPTQNEGAKVTSVGRNAFARAGSVVDLYVPEGIEYIGTYAFSNCPNLQSVHLPATLQTLGYGAFGVVGKDDRECARLKEICYEGTTEQWTRLYGEYNGAWSTLKDVVVHCSDGDLTL